MSQIQRRFKVICESSFSLYSSRINTCANCYSVSHLNKAPNKTHSLVDIRHFPILEKYPACVKTRMETNPGILMVKALLQSQFYFVCMGEIRRAVCRRGSYIQLPYFEEIKRGGGAGPPSPAFEGSARGQRLLPQFRVRVAFAYPFLSFDAVLEHLYKLCAFPKIRHC